MNVKQFLLWLTSAAGSAAALSFIAERLPAFQKLTPAWRGYSMLGGSLAIALGAYAILTYVPPEMLEQIKPIFELVAAVVGSWIVGQVAHTADPERVKLVQARASAAAIVPAHDNVPPLPDSRTSA